MQVRGWTIGIVGIATVMLASSVGQAADTIWTAGGGSSPGSN